MKRGRKRILTPIEVKEVQDAAKKLRAAPSNEGLTTGTVAAIARGVVARTRPASLAKNGGLFHLGRSWAKYFLSMEEWRPYAATSDRTVPPELVFNLQRKRYSLVLSQVLNAARGFFGQLALHIPPKQLTFNWDEYCVLLGPNRKWTWHPMRERRSVSIRQTKAAFTCTVLTGMF